MRILALDIGGTAVKYGLFRNNDIKYGQFSVRDNNGIENIPESVCSFAKEHTPDFIAISAPGPFDFETGTGLMTHKLLSLYNISLKKEFSKILPGVQMFFIHDSTAFAVGVLCKNSNLKKENIGVVMLGTGLGYSFVNKGKIILNAKQTPLHPLCNRPFLDGKAEDYVSTRVILSEAEKLGYKFDNVYDISMLARNNNSELLDVFYNYGKNLGLCIVDAKKTDNFSQLVVGGQISRSWDLMKDGFESVCDIKYGLVEDPTSCAIDGLYECVIKGKENFYRICEE